MKLQVTVRPIVKFQFAGEGPSQCKLFDCSTEIASRLDPKQVRLFPPLQVSSDLDYLLSVTRPPEH
jgi:hypothetical protein